MNEAVSDTQRNTCATSEVTAVESKHMAYLILEVNGRIRTDLSNMMFICSRNKIVHFLNNYPKHVKFS
jgi:hypothetical protein